MSLNLKNSKKFQLLLERKKTTNDEDLYLILIRNIDRDDDLEMI